MTFIRRICSIGLACSILFSTAFIPAIAQTPGSRTLVLNQQTEHEIKGGETQFYVVNIGANQTARVEIEHKVADLALAAFKPTGEKYIEADSPAGMSGRDSILVTAIEAGEYKIRVETKNPKADAGKYTIKLTEIRPTVAEDHQINEAAKKIKELAAQAESLRAKGRDERRQAVDAYAQVAELSRVKKDKTWETVALVEGGDIVRQLGELQKSVEMTEAGLRLAREIVNREHEGSALNNLGVVYKELGDYEKGILYLTEALDIQRETNDKLGEAIVLNNLGGNYLLAGNLAKAEELYLQSIVLRRQMKDRRGEGNVLNNIGQVAARREDYAKANEYLEQALVIRRELGDKTGEAITLRNLAKNYRETGDKAKAADYYGQANTLAKQLGDRRVEAESAYGLALAERERGNLAKAIETVESGLALIEQTRGELVNPELRTVYFASVLRYYELYIDLLVERYAQSKNEADIALALQTSERSRTRSLIELLQEARVNIKQGVDGKTLEQARDLQEKLNLQYRRRTAALAQKAKPETLAKITSDINSLTTELEAAQVKIRRDNPRYADLTQGTTISAKEIQALLDDETVLLEYKLGETRSFLWLVSKTSVKIHTLPKQSEIEKTARAFYDALVSRDKTKETLTAELSNKLGQTLLAPVAAEIENKRLAIVADGVLQFVPFAALSIREEEKRRRGVEEKKSVSPKISSTPPLLRSSSFLIETNEIINLPSASVLPLLRENLPTRPAAAKSIALFADAVFTADDTRLPSAKKTAAPAKPIEVKLNPALTRAGLSRLPFSRREANAILALAPKTETFSALDFAANRDAVLKMDLKPFRIVHFATHGWLDAEYPQFSGIVLSLVNERGEPLEGFLRLNEIYNLDLAADLVVLSACQTGLGKTVSGEGVIGLTRGFMYAGATRVMSSLWNVDDAATAELMRRFYQNLLREKRPAAAALRAAQISLVKEKRWQNPYFWAAFSIQGEWR